MTSDEKFVTFQATVWQHFKLHGRHDLPWRLPQVEGSFDPYKILVSEIMLQQTQVPRVIPKYQQFLDKFPAVDSLAAAPLAEVLKVWNGLGYNRRAKFLWQAAQAVQRDYRGVFPEDISELTKLPGVGKNTAGAVLAYAFNQPVVFVETNIRTAYIFHFFHDRSNVSDEEILEMLTKTFPRTEGKEQERFRLAEDEFISSAPSRKTAGLSRLWYWALMDYGAFIKQTIGNLNKLSNSYVRQSPFEGSRRQIRGQVIRLLTAKPTTRNQLRTAIADERLGSVLKDLRTELLIKEADGRLSLS